MQLKQLFHMLRAATPDEPAPKAAPRGPGSTFAAVLSGTLEGGPLQDAPREVRQALHGMIRQATDGEAGSLPEGLPDGLTDALRHSLEALLKETGADTATDGPAEETPEAGAPAPHAPGLVLKADGTVQLRLPSDHTAPGKDGPPPSTGRASSDAPRYTQPGGPTAHDPAVPADHRVRHPKAQEDAKTGKQSASSADGNAKDAPAPQAPRLSAGPNAGRLASLEPTTQPAPTPAPTPATTAAAVAEAITRLAAEGSTTAEGSAAQGTETQGTEVQRTAAQRTAPAQTRPSNAPAPEPATGDAARRLQTAAGARTAPAAESPAERNAENTPAHSRTAAATTATPSTTFPAEAAPVLYAPDAAPTDQGDAKTTPPPPQSAAGPATSTIDAPDGAGEALELNTKPSSNRGSQVPTASAEGEKSAASSPSTAEPRTAGPPAPDTPTPDPGRLAPRPPALSNTPSNASSAEGLPDDASADVRREAAAQARAEQAPATRTDGGGLALRVNGDVSLQPRTTPPPGASADAAPAGGTSAEGGATRDQDGDADPQQRHRDAQALQQALRLARQKGSASAPPGPPLPQTDFSSSLSEALATLSSDRPTVTTTEEVDGEAQLLRHALEGVLSEVKPSRTTPARATAAPGASQANMNAWMKTLMNQPARAFALNNGWQVLQVQLEDGQGSLTVSARRDDDGMAVSVGFTDPALRGQAAVQAGRIQDALQAQYQTQVDFSLQDDTQGQSSRDRSDSGRPSQPLDGADIEPDTLSSAASSSVRAALLGANHEWIA